MLAAALVVFAGHAAYAQLDLYPKNTSFLTSYLGDSLRDYLDAQIALGNGGVSLKLNSGINEPGKFVGSWNTGVSIDPLSHLGTTGGSVKVIFLGKTAGWNNDFGYVTDPPPMSIADYQPLITGIGSPLLTLNSGNYIDLLYGPGDNPIDFFINAVPSVGDPHLGGTYFAFGTQGDPIAVAPDLNVKWKDFWIDGVLTTVVGFEDYRPTDAENDKDYNDLVMIFQFLPGETAVPEPSTYGLIGAAALIGLIGYRRYKNKGSAKAALPA